MADVRQLSQLPKRCPVDWQSMTSKEFSPKKGWTLNNFKKASCSLTSLCQSNTTTTLVDLRSKKHSAVASLVAASLLKRRLRRSVVLGEASMTRFFKLAMLLALSRRSLTRFSDHRRVSLVPLQARPPKSQPPKAVLQQHGHRPRNPFPPRLVATA